MFTNLKNQQQISQCLISQSPVKADKENDSNQPSEITKLQVLHFGLQTLLWLTLQISPIFSLRCRTSVHTQLEKAQANFPNYFFVFKQESSSVISEGTYMELRMLLFQWIFQTGDVTMLRFSFMCFIFLIKGFRAQSTLLFHLLLKPLFK